MAGVAAGAHDAVMDDRSETLLCHYVTAAGRHELIAVRDELSLTYGVMLRRPDGGTRMLRELVPSLRNARRWALHQRHKAMIEDLDVTAGLGRRR
jgi:hypothetical protein